MVWDAAAKLVGVKAIGTVESNLIYDAINYNDPITVGIAQWYGVRAAAILMRMRDENPSSWTGVAASIDSSLSAHSANDSYWNTRYVTGSEGSTLKPVLAANTAIQDDQLSDDIDGYKSVAESNGMDADANTNGVLFFAVMYHQSPREALRVVANAGPDSSMSRLRQFCLNNSVLGRYKTRYNSAYDIIASGDSTGVGDGGTVGDGDPGGNTGSTRPTSDIVYLRLVGDNIHVVRKDGSTLPCYHDGRSRWIPAKDSTLGSPVDPGGNTGGSTDPSTDQAAIRAWMIAHENAYAYGQGAGRLKPDSSGYTDCSGVIRYCYAQTAGIETGTWTGDMLNYGRKISGDKNKITDSSFMEIGDLILIKWHSYSPSTYDHVVIYMGDGLLYSHGGPGSGPDPRDADTYVTGIYEAQIRRYL